MKKYLPYIGLITLLLVIFSSLSFAKTDTDAEQVAKLKALQQEKAEENKENNCKANSAAWDRYQKAIDALQGNL